MQAYLDIVRRILETGMRKKTRQGPECVMIPGMFFEHDMAKGFPLLTTKKIPFRLIATELEFFIKGITDKHWLQERKNHIWDEWASPQKAPYGHDAESKKRMLAERDLGPVYGFQWRHFGAEYTSFDADYAGKGIDQLASVIRTLSNNPSDRRMIVSAWNPSDLHKMGLPACHYSWQVLVVDGKLNLLWNQRSVDVMLGLPFNISSYALLLHLLAKEAHLGEGRLIGFLADCHIFDNHVVGAKEQLSRQAAQYPLPTIETTKFESIFTWTSEQTTILNYQSHPKIEFEIAI